MSRTVDAAFPGVMRNQLCAVRIRQASFAVLQAIAWAGAALLTAMIAAMVVDWAVTLFDVRVRMLLTSSCLIFALCVLCGTGWRPLRRSFGWTRAAEQVDQRVPQMEERWKTVASLAESGDEPSDILTRAMLARVKSEAVVMSRLVRSDRVVGTEILRRPMISLCGATVMLGVFFISNWGQTSILWQRFWSPTANISATQLSSLTGDLVVPRGSTVEVVARIDGLQRMQANLRLKRESSPETEETLTATPVLEESKMMAPNSKEIPSERPKGEVTFAVDVDETITYQVTAGDGRTEWHQIKAIDFPELRDVRLTVTPPTYVNEPPSEKNLIPNRLRALQGSHLELAIKPQIDLKSLRLQIDVPVVKNAEDAENVIAEAASAAQSATSHAAQGAPAGPTNEEGAAVEPSETIVLTRGDDGWYRFEQVLDRSFSFTPILVSTDELQNKNPRLCRVEVVDDHAPVARIVSPSGESSIGSEDTLEIRFEAHDDHGIATAELVLYQEAERAGDPPKVLEIRPIPLGDQTMRKHVMGKLELDLKELNLENGATISYSVRVTDNRNVNLESEMPVRRSDERIASNQQPKTPKNGATTEASSQVQASQAEDSRTDGSRTLSTETEMANSGDRDKSDENMTELSRGDLPAGKKKQAARENSPAASVAQNSLADGESNTQKKGANSEPQDRTVEHAMDSQLSSADLAAASQTISQEPDASRTEGIRQEGNDKRKAGAAGDRAGETQNGRRTLPDSEIASSDRSDQGSSDGHPAEALIAAKDRIRASTDPAMSASEPTVQSTKNGAIDSAPAPNTLTRSGSESNDDDQETTAANESAEGKSAGSPDRSMPADRAVPADKSMLTDKPVVTDETVLAAESAPSNMNIAGNSTQRPESDSRSDEQKLADEDGVSSTAKLALGERQPADTSLNAEGPSANQGLSGIRQPRAENSTAAGGFSPPPTVRVKLTPQSSESGQQQETDRRRLRIVSMLEAVAKSEDPRRDRTKPIRDKVVQIDAMLEVVEAQLTSLYRHETQEDLRREAFQELDVRLKNVEEFVVELEESTRETVYEFVGLQMIDISSTHITPGRDAVFIAIRRPDSGADLPAEEALHHIVSARELLQALLKRYDSVAREKELAEKMDDAVKMYSVYVERSQRLMREAQRNRDPFRVRREMAVVEVDQAYLDRLAEVTRMRRDMMTELARILSDDPRLRSRYLDLIRRRRSSIGNQLAELAARQDQAAQEVLGWLSVDENQRDNYWLQISDLRLDAPSSLAKEAQQLADHIEKQLPLVLDPGVGSAAATIHTAKQIALDARRCDLAVRQLRKSGESASGSSLSDTADLLVDRISDLSASLDQLQFEAGTFDGVSDYVQRRQIEVQALADQADHWSVSAHAIEQQNYSELAGLDQHQISISTEVLRTEMLDIEADLAGQFNDEVKMPREVVLLTHELQRIMERITNNQSAATFSFSMTRVDEGAPQQELAMKGFEEAQLLFNQLRRKTVEALDQMTVRDPSIADLRDPTLDQFLAELEREPNIEAQLGIPNRPRNVRVLQDALTWNQNGAGMLGTSGEIAMARIQQMVKQRREATDGDDPASQEVAKTKSDAARNPESLTDEEKQQIADSEEMQKMLRERMEQAKEELERQARDPSKSEEERRRAVEMAAQMDQSLKEMDNEQTPEQLWRQMVEADQAKALLEALAKGEQVPDEQWNKLLSTLGDGVGQVTGRVPSEDYRRSIEQYQERIRQLTGH